MYLLIPQYCHVTFGEVYFIIDSEIPILTKKLQNFFGLSSLDKFILKLRRHQAEGFIKLTSPCIS